MSNADHYYDGWADGLRELLDDIEADELIPYEYMKLIKLHILDKIEDTIGGNDEEDFSDPERSSGGSILTDGDSADD